MCLCICCIVLTLGLILFFSDYGLFLIQLWRFKLCFLTPKQVITKILHEKNTQTDQFPVETLSQDVGRDECCSDVTDFTRDEELAHEVGHQCPNVKNSLLQVFECAYSQLILTWYSVPEPRDNQPLYIALGREFDLLVDRVIKRASDINISAIAVDSVRILTQHLRNAKQPDRGQLFSSRADEIAVLRVFSEALLRNLFPESLTSQDLTRCALNEIVTLKVLELLVNWLSDPDNLNQLVVSRLDAIALKSSVDELLGPEGGDTPCSLDSEGIEVIAEGLEDVETNDVKPKKKGRKIKEKFSKIFEKIKNKEAKKKRKNKNEEETYFRCLEIEMPQPDFQDGFEACHTLLPQDSNSDDSDLENVPLAVEEEMIEFKLSYEMWRLSCWVVSVKQVQEEDGELSFTICLEEASNPEKVHWDVRKSQMDIRQFYSSLQDGANLPSIAELLESTENTMNNEFKEQARTTLETFLQELVKDSQLGQSPDVFQFLCPLEQLLTGEQANGGVWSLLSNLAHILTPTKGEEEDAIGPAMSDDPGTEGVEPVGLAETGDEETDMKGSCDPLCQFIADSGRLLPVDSGDSSEGLEEAPEFRAASFPVTGPSQDGTCVKESYSTQDDGGQQNDFTDRPCFPFKARLNKPFNRRGKGLVNVGRVEGRRTQEPSKRDVDQSCKERQEATKAIIDLLKEISGNQILWNICDVILIPFMPILKRKVNCFLNKMNPTEPQVASYIDRLREKQWPGGVPVASGPDRTQEQKSETKDRAYQLISTRCSNAFLKKNDVEAVFKIFQDTEENKKLFYMLLSFLLRELMPGESSLNVQAIAFLNSPV